MKYLDCIELLNLALQQLRKGQRDQVPLTKLQEVLILVTQSYRRTDNTEAQTALGDVINGLNVAQQNTAVKFLPITMKEVLVQGIDKALIIFCDLAWDYYMDHDVPEDQFELLRLIVEYHYLKGSVITI